MLNKRVWLPFLIVLLALSALQAESLPQGPLQVQGDLFEPLIQQPGRRTPAGNDTAVRAKVVLTNPKKDAVKAVSITGRFFNAQDDLLFTDRQTVETVPSKGEVVVDLYWPNPSSLLVDRVETSLQYEFEGEKCALEAVFRRPNVNYDSGY